MKRKLPLPPLVITFFCLLLLPPISSAVSFRHVIMPWTQFETVDDVPQQFFQEKRSVYAFVERVIDGDTIRVRHYPGFAIRHQKAEPLKKRAIADCTLSIRIYGVDTPELAKFGNPSQPFAQEAKSFTSDLVLHKMVKITFLRKDQYRRAVCQVKTLPKFGWWCSWVPGFGLKSKDLTLELARSGLAELYTGGGAEYFGEKERLERLISRSQRRNKGIWSLGQNRVSASEEKRRIRNYSQPVQAVVSKRQASNTHTSNLSKKKKQAKKESAFCSKKTTGKRGETFLESVLTGLEVAAT